MGCGASLHYIGVKKKYSLQVLSESSTNVLSKVAAASSEAIDMLSPSQEEKCHSESKAHQDDATSSRKRSHSIDEKEGFHSQYVREKLLGEGAHGIVFQCRHRRTHIQYAVKLVEMDAEQECLHEVEIMKKVTNLDPRGVVRLIEFFQDHDFCYIVMQKYNGGDLVDVVQHHLAKGIDNYSRVLSRLFKQMMQAVASLHSLELIHRDVKADNFLLDRFDITDENVRVVLSDLGTVVEIKSGEMLSVRAGTQVYWAPEVVKNCYSFPADVWAIGIILYGIVYGTFPFKNDNEILVNEPDFCNFDTFSIESDAIDFMQALMQKDQASRPTAHDALKLAWIASDQNNFAEFKQDKPTLQASNSKLHLKAMEDLHTQEKPSQEIKQRRQQLISKKDKANRTQDLEVADNEAEQNVFQIVGPFTTNDPNRNLVRHWDWWPVAKMTQDGKLPRSGTNRVRKVEDVADSRNLEMSWTSETVVDFLRKKGIDVSTFGVGRAKTVAHIAEELRQGECLFMEDANGNFYRIVDLVVLRVIGPAGRMLVETSNKGSETNRLPGTKKRPMESVKATALRLMSQYVGCPHEAVDFIEGSNELILEFAESPAYPGLKTVYRKYISEARFSTKDDEILKNYGLPECTDFTHTSLKHVRTWAWWSLQKCEGHGITVIGSEKKSGFEGMKLADPSLQRWTVDEIREKLTEHGINTALYGQGKTRSLEQVAREVQHGDYYFMERKGKMLRVVEDTVLVRIMKQEHGQDTVLVEVKQVFHDGSSKMVEQLPHCSRTPGDNIWHAAQRLLETIPKFANENVRIRVGYEQLMEEGDGDEAYPELYSLHRKHYVDAVFRGPLN